jgi:hypothetical protein
MVTEMCFSFSGLLEREAIAMMVLPRSAAVALQLPDPSSAKRN